MNRVQRTMGAGARNAVRHFPGPPLDLLLHTIVLTDVCLTPCDHLAYLLSAILRALHSERHRLTLARLLY